MLKPSKYRQNYGDFLVRSCMKALQLAQAANHIYLSESAPSGDKALRRSYLMEARNILFTIPTSAQIFLDLIKYVDGANQKLNKEKEHFGEKCNLIIKLINGVLEADKKYGLN